MRVTASEGINEGVSEAAAEADAADVVEAAGRFRIYLGAAAGVGKTYDMLCEGHRRQERGADVVIGFVECHGRRLTEKLIEGLEVVPRKTVEYRGSRLEEMDLDAVLRRQPKIALIDELAHTNVPGSGPHEKRRRDLMDVLGVGIDVITTVNIQHLESIADGVEHMTGVKVRERVPDWVVRKADQIKLVDSSPEQLRRRMLHGNISPKERVPPDALLRRAARVASRVKGELDVVHVAAGGAVRSGDQRSLERLRQLATDVGARWYEIQDDDPAQAIVRLARGHQITQIVIGSSQRSRWQQLTGGGSNVMRIMREAGEFGIDIHVIARRELASDTA